MLICLTYIINVIKFVAIQYNIEALEAEKNIPINSKIYAAQNIIFFLFLFFKRKIKLKFAPNIRNAPTKFLSIRTPKKLTNHIFCIKTKYNETMHPTPIKLYNAKLISSEEYFTCVIE